MLGMLRAEALAITNIMIWKPSTQEVDSFFHFNMFIQIYISVVVMGSLLASCFRSKSCMMYVSVGGLLCARHVCPGVDKSPVSSCNTPTLKDW